MPPWSASPAISIGVKPPHLPISSSKYHSFGVILPARAPNPKVRMYLAPQRTADMVAYNASVNSTRFSGTVVLWERGMRFVTTRRQYPTEFRQQMIELVRAGVRWKSSTASSNSPATRSATG